MTIQPAYCRPLAYAEFSTAIAGRPLVAVANEASYPWLFRAAWALALHESPEANLAAGETAVENLVGAVKKRLRSNNKQAVLAHFHDLFFDVLGFAGNTQDYYAPSNSYLPAVMRTQRGLPITLTLLYARVAAGLGLQVYGVNAPGHFLAEVVTSEPSQSETTMFVDPFYRGGVLTETEVLARVAQATGRIESAQREYLTRATPREWLSRLLMNLQAALAAAGRERDVLAMQELQQCLEEAK